MRRWRIVAWVVGVALFLSATTLLGGGWYLSDVLKEGALMPHRAAPRPDLEVVAATEGLVTLRLKPTTDNDGLWKREGIWGLTWEAGYGQVGAIRSIGEREVVREFFPLRGEPRTGESARLEGFAFPGDPQKAFGLAFREVSYSFG